MKVYVSWASVKEAENGALKLGEWADGLSPKQDKDLIEKLKLSNTMPEYEEYLAVQADAPKYDKLNQNLLAVRFVTPKLGRTVSYNLAKRLPDSGKLPVSVAARSHLLKTFEGEWDYAKEKPQGNVTFVGHTGTKLFLDNLSYACAAIGHPFPPCFEHSEVREYGTVRDVLDAAAVNEQDAAEKAKYVDMLTGWMGPGSSAARDGALMLSFGFLMGWEVAEDDRPE